MNNGRGEGRQWEKTGFNQGGGETVKVADGGLGFMDEIVNL